MAKKRVAVLISGRGSNMVALIEAAKDPSYPAEIALVLSNRPEAAGLACAQAMGIPTAVVDHRPHGEDRAAFERALQGVLDQHRAEVVCLGGFMRLFTPDFVLRWQGRMLNIHPSLLPAFHASIRTGRRCAQASRSPVQQFTSSSLRPMPARSSRRRRCLCATTTMSTRLRLASLQPSTVCTRRRSLSSRPDGSGSSALAA